MLSLLLLTHNTANEIKHFCRRNAFPGSRSNVDIFGQGTVICRDVEARRTSQRDLKQTSDEVVITAIQL